MPLENKEDDPALRNTQTLMLRVPDCLIALLCSQIICVLLFIETGPE